MLRNAVPIAEVRRGDIIESEHSGHIVVAGPDGDPIEAHGDPDMVVLPRSSAKMCQALPLVASGAAEAAGLTDRQLALACASHQGAPLHVEAVGVWLRGLGFRAEDLLCGAQPPWDGALRRELIRDRADPSTLHNNCSGKHAGFLTLMQRIGGGADYVAPDHPVQRAARAAFEEATGQTSPGFGIDGCSAPNFATTMAGMARAMARFATAGSRGDAASRAMARLVAAMISHPVEVAGDGRACTRLMQAASEPVAVKTGAEGFFVAILPERGVGVAIKAADGATRAAEAAVAAVLVRLGALDPAHPEVARVMQPTIVNRRGIVTGDVRPAPWLRQTVANASRA